MDGTRFDRLSRALGARSGRRQVLAGLIGGAIAAATGREAFAQDEGLKITLAPPPSETVLRAQAERAKNNRRCRNLDDTCKNDGQCCGDLTCKGKKNKKTCVCRSKACFINSWGSYGTNGNQRFNSPYDAAVNTKNGDVYVADTGNNRIMQFDQNGRFIRKFGSRGYRGGQFQQPISIAVNPDRGRVYISDFILNKVSVFNLNGNYLGDLAGQSLLRPFGVTVESSGKILVVDSGKSRILRYAANEWYESTPASGAGTDRGKFSSPSGVAVSRGFFVADQGSRVRIQKFDLNGRYRDQFSDRLSQPWNMDASERRLYVADAGGNQIVIYDDDGDFRAVFGRTGSATLNSPRGVAANGKTIYVANTWRHEIQKWVVR